MDISISKSNVKLIELLRKVNEVNLATSFKNNIDERVRVKILLEKTKPLIQTKTRFK